MSTVTSPLITATKPAPLPVNGPPRRRPKTYGLDPTIYRFSVAQYERMADLGILGPEDKVELLEGYVVLKMARNPPHDGTMDLVEAALNAVRPPGWMVRCQRAIKLADSVPEPDYSVVRGNPRTYLNRHPVPADVGLVVEVANTSLALDIEDKAQLYADGGIVAYWVVDVINNLVHVFSQPSGSTYAGHVVIRPPAVVPLTLDGVAVGPVPAADLLP